MFEYIFSSLYLSLSLLFSLARIFVFIQPTIDSNRVYAKLQLDSVTIYTQDINTILMRARYAIEKYDIDGRAVGYLGCVSCSSIDP